MAILQVLNVWQGDSMILRPDGQCRFKDEIFVIDLGPGRNDITEYISSKEKVNIILTHHDTDHFGGFKFFIDKSNQLQRIFIPFHQNEITLIAKSILNLKGIKSAEDCGEFIGLLQGIVENQLLLKSFFEKSANSPVLSFAYDGRSYCDHIICMNSPVLLDTYDWLAEMSEDDLSRIMQEIFEPTYAEAIRNYIRLSSFGRNQQYADSSEIYDIFLRGDSHLKPEFDEVDEVMESGIYRSKGNFVINFIIENLELFRKFNNKPIRKNLQIIFNNYVLCTHDVCVVIKARFQKDTFLLTGDASKKCFIDY